MKFPEQKSQSNIECISAQIERSSCPFHLFWIVIASFFHYLIYNKNLVISSINFRSGFNCFICSCNFFLLTFLLCHLDKWEMTWHLFVRTWDKSKITRIATLLYERGKMFRVFRWMESVFHWFLKNVLPFLPSAIHLHEGKTQWKASHNIISFASTFRIFYIQFNSISFDFNAPEKMLSSMP